MINPSPLFWAFIACGALWCLVGYAVLGDSRQKCEQVGSLNTCSWELR